AHSQDVSEVRDCWRVRDEFAGNHKVVERVNSFLNLIEASCFQHFEELSPRNFHVALVVEALVHSLESFEMVKVESIFSDRDFFMKLSRFKSFLFVLLLLLPHVKDCIVVE